MTARWKAIIMACVRTRAQVVSLSPNGKNVSVHSKQLFAVDGFRGTADGNRLPPAILR